VSPPAPATLKPLATFDSYGPEARKAAVEHFGESIEEIESLLDKPSPDEDLREDLAWALWKYARGKANEDGSVPESLAQVSRYIESLDEPARQLRDALERLNDAYMCNDAAAVTVDLMLDAARSKSPGAARGDPVGDGERRQERGRAAARRRVRTLDGSHR
jgi:hypothetical protein